LRRSKCPERGRGALFVVLLALACAFFTAGSARAQSCCGVVAEDELAVVSPHRRAVVTTRVTLKRMLGRHDLDGRYRSLDSGVSATDAQLTLGGGLRFPFYDRLQVHGALSGRLQHRRLPDEDGSGTSSALAGGLGDVSGFLRWSASFDDQRGLVGAARSLVPSLDLYAGAKAPSAAYHEGISARDVARTMGDGAWGIVAGARLIKYLTPAHAARVSLRYDARLWRDADADVTGFSRFSPGDQVGLTLAYLGLKGMWWMFGCTADFTFTLPSSARTASGGSRSLSGTEMRETVLGVHLTRVLLMPRLDLTGSLSYTLPLPKLSQNLSFEGVLAGLALRYHVM
jgi:hypothetical protein